MLHFQYGCEAILLRNAGMPGAYLHQMSTRQPYNAQPRGVPCTLRCSSTAGQILQSRCSFEPSHLMQSCKYSELIYLSFLAPHGSCMDSVLVCPRTCMAVPDPCQAVSAKGSCGTIFRTLLAQQAPVHSMTWRLSGPHGLK